MIDYRIVKQHENSIIVDMMLAETHPFFDGHFETAKIFPAVAQLVTIQHLVIEKWGVYAGFQQLKQVKFKAPITPEMPLRVTVERLERGSANEFAFQFQSGDDLKSSGCLMYGQ